MHEAQVESVPVQRPVVIAVRGEPHGVVVPTAGGVRFLAVKFAVFSIDGRTFPDVEAAERAAARAVAEASAN